MKGNVLIIDTVIDSTNTVTLHLANEGFSVKAVSRAEDAFPLLDTWNCNLIILEINLPGMDGFEFLARFTKTRDTPVIIISARTSEEDQIIGLGIGADEYITKPFSPRVLTARVRSMFRRMGSLSSLDKETRRVCNFGPYVLDMDARTLQKGTTPIELSAKEYALLAFLAEHDGKPLKAETIYENVWEEPVSCLAANGLSTVPVHIQRLRKKIENDPAKPVWLLTSRGMGYKLSAH